MFSGNRRRFLGQAAAAGIACSTNLAFGRFLPGQTQTPNRSETVRVYLDYRRTLAPLDRNLFGSFLGNLRSGLALVGRQRFSQRRDGRSAPVGSADCSLSRRKFCVRL